MLSIHGSSEYVVEKTILRNFSVKLWRPVLLVEETGIPGENRHPVQVTNKLIT
jgi:hypothetical protein